MAKPKLTNEELDMVYDLYHTSYNWQKVASKLGYSYGKLLIKIKEHGYSRLDDFLIGHKQ